MSTESIYIPLRGGDLTLTQNDAPDEDGFVTLTDPEADMHITLPAALFERLAEVGDVVTLWGAGTDRPASSEREGQR
jgi:hypothetical protein